MKMKIRLISVVLFLVAIGAGLCFSRDVKLTKVREWGTMEYKQIVVQGNYAYCAASFAGLDILDISNPTRPVKIGSIDTIAAGAEAISVAVSGNYAYVGHNEDFIGRLRIVDISNPRAPRLMGYYSKLCSEPVLAASGNYLYEAGGYGIKIFDVSNPSSPKLVKTFTAPGLSRYIFISGHYAYVASTGGFHILDIAKPTNLTIVGAYTGVSLEKVVISGKYAYVSGNLMLQALDISNPANPTLVGTYDRIGFDENVDFAAAGHYVYLTTKYCDYECQEGEEDPSYFLQVVDFADPDSPIEAGAYETPADIKAVALKGTYLYASSTINGLLVIDVSDPSAPGKVGSLDEVENPRNVRLSGKYAYLPGGKSGLLLLDISNPAAPVKKGKYTEMTSPLDVAVSGNYAYLVNFAQDFHVVDISNPEAPVRVGKYTTSIIPGRVVVSGNRAYLANTYYGGSMEVVNIANPKKPVQSAMWTGSYDEAAVSGSHVFAAQDHNYFKDMTDGRCKLNGNIQAICFSGQYAYIGALNGKLAVVRLSDTSAPAPIKQGFTRDYTYGVAASGKYLFASVRYDTLQVLDISNPEAPEPFAVSDTPVVAKHVAASGNYAYLTGGASGKLYIYQVSEVPAQSLTITSPNGGETWQRGVAHDITWTQTGLTGNVTIDLYKGGVFSANIGTAAANAGTFSWTPPDAAAPGADYKVRLYQGSVNDYSDNNFSITAPPKIMLNRQGLNFGVAPGGTTRAQTVIISNSGGGTLNWTASADAEQTWILVSPAAGTGTGFIQVEVNPAGLAAGTYTGKVSVADPAASNSPSAITVTLIIWETGAVPFGEFATPVDGTTVSGSVPVTGWALDDLEVMSVKIYRDPVSGEGSERVYIGDAVFVEGARPDVEQAYPDYPWNYRAGWGYMMLTNMLPNQGNGAFKLYSDAEDKEGNIVSLGTKTITCDNANAVKPFGAIDTPIQGGTASGKSYPNFGWALTPMPNMIPIDGSIISVWVDGKVLGHPVYNIYREDIPTKFPGYANSDGAVGYYHLDTTQYANGVHSIAWTVRDNAGNEEGIGSRYFSSQNTSSDISRRGAAAFSPWSPAADSCASFSDRCAPVRVKKGFSVDTETNEIYPDEEGVTQIEIRELERLEIHFSKRTVNISPLPVGSTFDPVGGVFYWQPGAGFIGRYRFVFMEKAEDGSLNRKEIIINILPKFSR